MAKPRQRGTIERTVRFYRVDAGLDAAGRPLPFDPTPSLQILNQMEDRYLEQPNRVFLSVVDSVKGHQIRFATIRRSDLPATDDAGALVPLSLPLGRGLAESIQIVFFPDQVVGADFNFYGPRASRFGPYHNLMVGEPQISIDPLLRQDVTQRLARLDDIRILRLKIRRPYVDVVRRQDATLGRAFDAAFEAGDADQAEITLSPRPYSRKEALSQTLKSVVRALSRRNDLEDNVRALQVRGYNPETDTVEEVDVLRAHLLTTKQVMRLNERSRSLDPDSAYRAIVDAYGELSDDIQEAAAIFGH